jgi:hypothetical protein
MHLYVLLRLHGQCPTRQKTDAFEQAYASSAAYLRIRQVAACLPHILVLLQGPHAERPKELLRHTEARQQTLKVGALD